MNTWFPENRDTKTVIDRIFGVLAFLSMAASDVHALQAALLLLPEHPGEVHCLAISCTPIPGLLEGLLSENEAGQLTILPQPSHKQ